MGFQSPVFSSTGGRLFPGIWTNPRSHYATHPAPRRRYVWGYLWGYLESCLITNINNINVFGVEFESLISTRYHLPGLPARHPVDDLLCCDGDNVDRQTASGSLWLPGRLYPVIDHRSRRDLIRPRWSVFLNDFLALPVGALTDDRLVSEAILDGVVREFDELRVCKAIFFIVFFQVINSLWVYIVFVIDYLQGCFCVHAVINHFDRCYGFLLVFWLFLLGFALIRLARLPYIMRLLGGRCVCLGHFAPFFRPLASTPSVWPMSSLSGFAGDASVGLSAILWAGQLFIYPLPGLFDCRCLCRHGSRLGTVGSVQASGGCVVVRVGRWLLSLVCPPLRVVSACPRSSLYYYI